MLSGYWLAVVQRAPARQGQEVNFSQRRAEAAARIRSLKTRARSQRPESSQGTRSRRQGHSTHTYYR
jgi:hypothetical protein